MKPQNLLIVTRRFWPHAGLTEIALGELAINLAKAGHDVTVATVQWSRTWSECIHYHGIPVIRFARPVTGPWTSFRYARSLARHFSTTSYDGIIVAGMSDESAAVLKTVNDFTPALLYIDESHLGAPARTQRNHMEILQSADAVVAGSESVAASLSGDQPLRIQTIPPGIPNSDRQCESRIQIRDGLSKAHPILALTPEQPLVVCCTRMNKHSRISDLILAWPEVLRIFPTARLWLLGEGKSTSSLWQQIVDMGLVESVLLPGFFDRLPDIFTAADLYVHAGGANQAGEGMLRAMAAGTATIAFANPYTKQLLSGQNGVLADDVDTMAAAIIDGLKNAPWRVQFGKRLTDQMANQYLPNQQVDRYINLIKSLSDQLVETAQ